MDMTPGKEIQSVSEVPDAGQETHKRPATRTPSIIVGVVAAVVVALSLFYLLRPEPLLVQGEADATRFDIAARVDGRVKEIPVERGQNVPAGAVLVRIDNPETLAKHEQMRTAKAVAEAQLANVLVGTRVETIAARKAEMERAQAALLLAQKTFDRTHTLTEQGNAPQAPLASQIYQRNVEPGEYVSPGVPLVTLIDLADVWIHFDLREDLVKSLKVGDRFDVRIPSLDERGVKVEVKLIATKGEYASWRATRASGDFDLRTFSIRAYPVQPVPELRPGMSAYLDWRSRQ